MFNILYTARVVPDAEVGNVVVKRVTGEIPSPDIVINAAVNIVAENSTFVIVLHVAMLFAAVRSGTKCGNFDYFPAETDMRQAESPPDKTAIAEERPKFLRMRVRRNIEVLGVQIQ